MTFGSVYEMFDPLSEVRKQHFWTWFSGSIPLKNYWNITNVLGTGSVAINDLSTNLGINVNTGSNINDETQINFNDIKPFSPIASVMISVGRPVANAVQIGYCGLSGDNKTYNGVEKALCISDDADTFFALSTADAVTSSDTEGSDTLDLNIKSWKLELNPSAINMILNGVTDVTKSTNLPTSRLQPAIGAKALASTTRAWQLNYYEAFNT